MAAIKSKVSKDKAWVGAVLSAVAGVVIEVVATNGFGWESLLAGLSAAIPVGYGVWKARNRVVAA